MRVIPLTSLLSHKGRASRSPNRYAPLSLELKEDIKRTHRQTGYQSRAGMASKCSAMATTRLPMWGCSGSRLTPNPASLSLRLQTGPTDASSTGPARLSRKDCSLPAWLALLGAAYLMFFVRPSSIRHEKYWRDRPIEDEPTSPWAKLARWLKD